MARIFLFPVLVLLLLPGTECFAAEPAPARWVDATAHALPKETTNQGSGYFSIVPGKNGRLYLGTAKYGVNAYLVEFDPVAETSRIVVDCQKEIGTTATGFAAQAKIHTRNHVGPSGRIYFGTKQGYPEKGEQRSDYPGGYPMVYDPQTGKTRVYPIPVPQQGIISIVPDESREVAYISSCSDERPVESTHFLRLDLKTGEYRSFMDCRHMYAFVCVDHLGRAYHPMLGGRIARYDPHADRLDLLEQTIDGQPPRPDSHLADEHSHPINWDISPDRRTLYAVAMNGNQLYRYDLTADGPTLVGRRVGPLLAGMVQTDCRALCVGPGGVVWAAVWGAEPTQQGWLHLVSYRPGDAAPYDHGVLRITNPDYTKFTGGDGKPLPWHHGMRRTEEGSMVPLYHMGIAETESQGVFVTVICPLTVLKIAPERLQREPEPKS